MKSKHKDLAEAIAKAMIDHHALNPFIETMDGPHEQADGTFKINIFSGGTKSSPELVHHAITLGIKQIFTREEQMRNFIRRWPDAVITQGAFLRAGFQEEEVWRAVAEGYIKHSMSHNTYIILLKA